MGDEIARILEGTQTSATQRADSSQRQYNVFFFHPSYSDQSIEWFPWLQQELKNLGWNVYTPRFPTPVHQSLPDWLKVFAQYKDLINEDTIFIGYRVGAAFALHLLSSLDVKISGALLVDPFIKPIQHKGVSAAIGTFVSTPVDWKKVLDNTYDIKTTHFTDSPFVLSEESQVVASALGTELTEWDFHGGWRVLEKIEEALVIVKQLTHEFRGDSEQKRLQRSLPEVARGYTPKKSSADYTTLPSVTTYYDDISDAIDNADARTMSTILHEERDRETIQIIKKRRSGWNFAYAILTIVLLGALGLAWTAFSPETVNIRQQQEQRIPTDFRVEDQKIINIFDQTVFELRNLFQNIHADPELFPRSGEIVHLALAVQDIASPRLAGIQELFKAFEIQIPPTLQESLEPDFMYGFYGAQDGKSHTFVVAKLRSFDGALEGIKEWEEDDMLIDLVDLTQTQEILKEIPTDKRTFSEEIIDNQTIQVLRRDVVLLKTQEVTKEVPINTNRQHILTDDSWDALLEIHDDSLVFGKAHPVIDEFSVGDVVIGYRPINSYETRNSSDQVGFETIVREIVDITFNETDTTLVVWTKQRTTSELLGSGGGLEPLGETKPIIETRVKSDGSIEYVRYITTQETIEVPGEPETYLAYSFLDEETMVIAEHEDVILEIIKRLRE